jgi:predicted flap endonuclease-1-like 5' DNA nuclease
MIEFNPHHLIDAWWQHLLMLLVAAILGYIIGYRGGHHAINSLEDQLARLGVELEKCRKSLVVLQPDAIAAKLTPKTDDLKRIEGIGPGIERLLHDADIRTFRALAETSSHTLQTILDGGGPRFQMHNPSTWPKQAELAAEGRWAELEKWQQELDGGL